MLALSSHKECPTRSLTFHKIYCLQNCGFTTRVTLSIHAVYLQGTIKQVSNVFQYVLDQLALPTLSQGHATLLQICLIHTDLGKAASLHCS